MNREVKKLRDWRFVQLFTTFIIILSDLQIEEYPDELPLSKAMLEKLEQLSALKFESLEEIESVEEDIRLAQKIFEVDTTVCFSIF